MTGDSLGEVIRRIGRSVSLQTDLALTDAQLLERFVARRDEPAFAALVARHGPMVLGVCRRLVRDAQESEDAFQATFLVLARKAAGIQRQPLLAGWLYGVAYRTAVRLRGQTARRRTREERDVDLTALAAADDGVDSEVRPLVHEEVGRLPDKYRSAIVLCYLEGKTNEEAALQLRWPVGSVKSRLARARDLLRTRLTRRGLTLSAGLLTTALVINKASASPALVNATIRGAALFAAGDSIAGVVTARAVKLCYGVLRTMIVTKAKILAALALTVAMLGGAGGVAYRSLAAGPDDTPKAAPMKTVSSDDRPNAEKEKPKAGESKADAAAIQGVWRVTAVETEGKDRDDDRAKRIKSQEWTINADKIFIKVEARAQKEGCPYKMDPTKTPKTIDITERTVGGDGEVKSERTRRTIYSLEGDVLKVCYGMSAAEIKHDDQDVGRRPRPFDPRDLMDDGGRPTELATKEGSRSTLFTLKREPADKDKANDDKESPPPAPKTEKKDKEALQGVWKVVAVEVDGKEADDEEAKFEKQTEWAVKNGFIRHQSKDPNFVPRTETFSVDSERSPKEINVNAHPIGIFLESDVEKGVYSLEGDVWKVCFPHSPLNNPPAEARKRPTELATKKGSQTILVTLKREPAVKPPDDNAALQGTWQVIGIERGGRQLLDDPEWMKYPGWPIKWVFKGDRLLRQGEGGGLDTVSTYSVDSSKTPNLIDETLLSVGQRDMASARKVIIPLIYSLKGDILKVCQPPDEVRPREFSARRTNQNILTTLKRASAIPPGGAKPADSPRPSVDGKGGEERTLQDWREAAKEAFRLHNEEFLAGKITVGTIIGPLQRLLDAELEGRTTQADRLATYEAHVRRVKDLMKVVNMKLDAGKMAPADAEDGEAYLLKAEFLLEREKAK